MNRYTWLALGICAAVLALGCLFNASVDPYRVLHPTVGEFPLEPNIRASKMRFLLQNCRLFDAYFVGDSRALVVSQRDLPRDSGLRFYNFAMPADEIDSILPRLRYLLRQGCPLKALIANVSLDAMHDRRPHPLSPLEWSEPPMISGENPLLFYDRYLFNAQPVVELLHRRFHPADSRVLYYADGHAEYSSQMQDPAGFTMPVCRVPDFTGEEWEKLRNLPRVIQDLARLSAEHHFRVAIWISPLNAASADFFDDPRVAAVVAQLHAIPDITVVEPDRHSALLSDFHEWHDCLHFRAAVFDRLIAPLLDAAP